MSTQFRRVGTARPSHLMYTSGVGALVDLPNLAVLVRGLDEWDYTQVPGRQLTEQRLLDAVRRVLGRQVGELRAPPWAQPADGNGAGKGTDPANLVGVPVLIFPQWLRCTYCNELAPIDPHGTFWQFTNSNPYRPDLARFEHAQCKKRGAKPLAVAARFVLACTAGHLDDFPYREFVHGGAPCQPGAKLRMEDYGGNIGPNVTIRCLACGAQRSMLAATGRQAERALPPCRGRHPHLSRFDAAGCRAPVKMLVVGASNQWFAENISVLAVPPPESSALQTEVAQLWADLTKISSRETLGYALEFNPALHPLRNRDPDEVMSAIEARRKELETGGSTTVPDLLAPEWEVFTAAQAPAPSFDFALRRPGVDAGLEPLFADVVQAERLREVKAFVGFTRIDAPDPTDPESTTRAPISRGTPEWVPASEVRGEGVFLRLHEDLVAAWEDRVLDSHAIRTHREAYRRFRENRNPGRDPGFDPNRGWPGARYIALHTLSHLLIHRIAMECGYSSASLAERIYSGTEDEPRGGILLYTAAPDSEGTLGGLVALGEPATLHRLMRGALDDARNCSSDPLCAERLPTEPADFLHGAACHVCLFVSETTCERGNRFLDRRFLVDLDDTSLVLTPEGL